MKTKSFKGNDLIKGNSELKGKLKEAIEGILNFISDERKSKILEKLVEKLSYIIF